MMKVKLLILIFLLSLMNVSAVAPEQTDAYELSYSSHAYIIWTTNITTDNRVEYSINSDMSSSSWSVWENTTTNPQILLDGLTRDTTYYYNASSIHSGDTTVSATQNFSTENNTHGFTRHFDRTFIINDIEGWSVGQSMFETYEEMAGEYIVWTLILGAVFIAFSVRQESVILPVVISLVSALFIFTLLPPEHDVAAKVLLGLSIAGILWHIFIGRR